MRKLVVGALIVAVALGTFAIPFETEKRPLVYYMFESLEQVKLEGTITGLGFLDGKFVVKISGHDEYVFLPLMVIREENLFVSLDETIEITGRKLVMGQYTLVIPEKIVYEGKEYDLTRLVFRMKMEREEMMKSRFRHFKVRGFGEERGFLRPGKPPMRAPFRAPMEKPRMPMGW